LGNRERIKQIVTENHIDIVTENHIDITDIPIVDPRIDTEHLNTFGELFFEKAKRRGFSVYEAKKVMRERNYYGAMMVETGQADALISGLTRNYADTIRPALRIIGVQEHGTRVAGMYIMMTKKGPLFFADTTINVNPTSEDLVEITLLTAKAVQQFNIKPRIALLSFSNFGTSNDPSAVRIRKAVEILHDKFPGMIVDGEMQANFALNMQMLHDSYPFCELINGGVNTLIFPNLDAGNIAYKLLQSMEAAEAIAMEAAEAIGPVLLGMKKPVHILQLGSSVRDIVNMVTIAVIDAQSRKQQ